MIVEFLFTVEFIFCWIYLFLILNILSRINDANKSFTIPNDLLVNLWAR